MFVVQVHHLGLRVLKTPVRSPQARYGDTRITSYLPRRVLCVGEERLTLGRLAVVCFDDPHEAAVGFLGIGFNRISGFAGLPHGASRRLNNCAS